MAKMENLQDLLHEQLKDIYDAEHQILQGLQQMINMTTSSQLKQAFQEHHHQTQEQIRRAEQVFRAMGKSPERKHCKAMAGLIAEGQELMQEQAPPEVMDAALIAAAQRIEHYEIAGYGTARTYAQMLGMQDAAQLLEQTLREEEQTDKRLTMLAESRINQRAQ